MNEIKSQTTETPIELKDATLELDDTSIAMFNPSSLTTHKKWKEETFMSEEPVIKLTRQQLYNEIWELSVAGVARKYDIPYTHLMKQLKEASIPVPPSGYWTLIKNEKSTTKPELPEPVNAVISIYMTIPRSQKKEKKELLVNEATNEVDQNDGKIILDSPSDDKILISEGELALNDTVSGAASEDHGIITSTVISDSEVQHEQIFCIRNRETLYKEVWASPVNEVAARYKVTDIAIQKICKALDVPMPPAGYWTKLRAGKSGSIPPLPQSEKISTNNIKPYATSMSSIYESLIDFLSEEDRFVIITVASFILLPEENTRMHPNIIEHRKVVAEWKKQPNTNDNRGWGRKNTGSPPFLADSISDESLPRACRIIDALIKAMEPLGCSLTDNLSFAVNGEIVSLTFSESKDEINHIPTKEENLQLLKYEEERKHNSLTYKPQIRKYDHIFNGKLSLLVSNRKSFRDCKSYVLEDRLGDFMIELYIAAEEIKKERKAREEAERKRQEEERRKEEQRKLYNVEVDRTLALTNLAEDYDTACKIRRYIAVVESTGKIDEKTTKWIEWANKKADWYDPTVAREDEYFGKRDYDKDAEKKKINYKSYW